MKRRQRKYQRVPANQFATIEVRESRKKKHQVVATIRSITCEGMGLHLEEAKHKLLPRGCFVIIRFSNGARTLELPAQVAWACVDAPRIVGSGRRISTRIYKCYDAAGVCPMGC